MFNYYFYIVFFLYIKDNTLVHWNSSSNVNKHLRKKEKRRKEEKEKEKVYKKRRKYYTHTTYFSLISIVTKRYWSLVLKVNVRVYRSISQIWNHLIINCSLSDSQLEYLNYNNFVWSIMHISSVLFFNLMITVLNIFLR